MKTRVSILAMSTLSDLQEEVNFMDGKELYDSAKLKCNWVKLLISKYGHNMNQEIDAEEVYKEFKKKYM